MSAQFLCCSADVEGHRFFQTGQIGYRDSKGTGTDDLFFRRIDFFQLDTGCTVGFTNDLFHHDRETCAQLRWRCSFEIQHGFDADFVEFGCKASADTPDFADLDASKPIRLLLRR